MGSGIAERNLWEGLGGQEGGEPVKMQNNEGKKKRKKLVSDLDLNVQTTQPVDCYK